MGIAVSAGPTISIVIVNWNGLDFLGQCLRSLEAQTERDFQTVVVDNGSQDGSLELLAKDFPWVETIAAGENLGFAEGSNRGIAAATGEWVATLNNDTTCDPRWIQTLRQAAREAGARVGMLQSCLVLSDRPDHTNSTGVLLFTDGTAQDRDFDAPRRAGDGVEEVFCCTAGASMYRRAMLDEIRLASGVFDRTFFMYFEDVDLGWRAQLLGWSALYVPEALVLHKFQASSRKHGNRFVGAHCKLNRVRTLLKNGSPLFLARTLPRTLLDACILVGWEGPRGIARFGKALQDGLRARGELQGRVRVDRRTLEARWVSKKKKKPKHDAAG
jgi:GT2 family glycosyltransferase